MKNNYIDVMEWSRLTVNSIMTAKNDSRYLYSTRISFRPNPLNYDGIDEVQIEIIEKDQISKNTRIFLSNKKYCHNIDEAVEEINKLVKLNEKR